MYCTRSIVKLNVFVLSEGDGQTEQTPGAHDGELKHIAESNAVHTYLCVCMDHIHQDLMSGKKKIHSAILGYHEYLSWHECLIYVVG